MPELTHSEANRVLSALEDKRQDAIDRGDLDELSVIDRRMNAIRAAMSGEVVRYADAMLPSRPAGPGEKDNVVAGVLALVLGGVGAHKFYLGKTGQGLVYLLFCWTLIPALLGLIEGVTYLVGDPEDFARKYS